MLKDIFFLTFGLFLQYLVISSKINFYVHPQYRYIIFAAGFIISIVYIIKLFNLVKGKKFYTNFRDKENWTYFILLLIIVIIAPAPLGTSLASNKTFNIVNEKDSISTKSRPVILTEEFTVEDWVNITTLSSNLDRYDDKKATVSGMLFDRGDEIIIGKFSIACCAVDASVVGVELILDNINEYKFGEWYEISGRTIVEGNNFYINVESILEIDEPANPYFTN